VGFGAVGPEVVEFPISGMLVPGEFPVAFSDGAVGRPVPVKVVVRLASFALQDWEESFAVKRDGFFTKGRVFVRVIGAGHVKEGGEEINDMADLFRAGARLNGGGPAGEQWGRDASFMTVLLVAAPGSI